MLHTIRSLEGTIKALKKQENDRQKNTAQWRLKREKKQKEESQNDLPPQTSSASSPNAAYMPKLPLIANVQKSFFIVLKNG
ncbi:MULTISPECIES: hypothetical protein [unclassified Saccharibacter]|uniref:hypothetical protein n=1 Tax=unclassified Saccharibacter TaxID=2648722 RepID=UPI001324D4F5|nr:MULTISPECIES: hypothetical protein [unclassified Saccharibacter]MXV36724.1 hypothetical protein [Saccharibacter sp. EH611]MXV58216.1 hypothetical protein [Saccharibacter sp. EH70]MXV65672.1 hypothetical protein [Saccharibacter sp. EH60]